MVSQKIRARSVSPKAVTLTASQCLKKRTQPYFPKDQQNQDLQQIVREIYEEALQLTVRIAWRCNTELTDSMYAWLDKADTITARRLDFSPRISTADYYNGDS